MPDAQMQKNPESKGQKIVKWPCGDRELVPRIKEPSMVEQ